MLCMFLPSGPHFLHSYLLHTYKVEVHLWAGSLCWVFSRGTITANLGLQAQFCTDNQWCPSRFQSYQTQGNCWWCLATCAQWRVCSWYALYSSTPVCKMSSLKCYCLQSNMKSTSVPVPPLPFTSSPQFLALCPTAHEHGSHFVAVVRTCVIRTFFAMKMHQH
jgi:hypothetical protein